MTEVNMFVINAWNGILKILRNLDDRRVTSKSNRN